MVLRLLLIVVVRVDILYCECRHYKHLQTIAEAKIDFSERQIKDISMTSECLSVCLRFYMNLIGRRLTRA